MTKNTGKIVDKTQAALGKLGVEIMGSAWDEMARMTKTEKLLTAAGFKIGRKHDGGRWFEVTTPDGELGAVLCQSFAAWHYFSEKHAATASSSNVARCHLDGLGDAIATDAQMDTYERLLQEQNVPSGLRRFAGVYAAMGQVGH
jgi:hypothetical protein